MSMVQGDESYTIKIFPTRSAKSPLLYSIIQMQSVLRRGRVWCTCKGGQHISRQIHHRSWPSSLPPSPGTQSVYMNSDSVWPDTLQRQMGSMSQCWTMSAHSAMTPLNGRQRRRVSLQLYPSYLQWSQIGRAPFFERDSGC